MTPQPGTKTNGENGTDRRWTRVSLAALVLVVLVGVSMTGSAAGQAVQVDECRELGNSGQTYEVTQNIPNDTISTCLDITAPDIVLDGQGHKVNGVNETQFSTGIRVSANNVTVKNFGNVTGWREGILLVESNNNTIIDNTANNNNRTGIQLGASDDNELTDNTANNNGNTGIVLTGSLRNDLTDNKANNNGGGFGNMLGTYGIWIQGGSNFNNLTDNVARDNSGGEESAGIYIGSQQQVSNNTLVDNEATGDQTYGIYLMQADDNELRDNTANENNQAGIYLTFDSSDNDLIDNIANRNGKGALTGPGIYGIWLDDESNDNTLTGNEAFDNGPRTSEESPENGLLSEGDETETNEVPVLGPNSAGIYLSGGEASVRNNTLKDNDVRDTDNPPLRTGGQQSYGIWLEQDSDENDLIDNTANHNYLYGIWLTQDSDENDLIGNTAEDNGIAVGTLSVSEQNGEYVEGSSGIYLGGTQIGTTPPTENTLVDNTARGSEYGIWIKNSFDNEVSESLAEDNYEGIAVEVDRLRRLDSVTPAQTGPLAGNTFTDDTSRNNEWDFVADVPLESFEAADSGSTGTLDTDIPVSTFPVTNLDIGTSTKSDTTLSFFSPDIRLRSVRTPVEDDPSGLTNIGRYFEAERTVTEVESVEPEQELPPLLFAAVSYEDGDVSNVDESTLELRRFNETAGEWQALENPLLDQADNLVAGSTVDTSNFGVFGEPTKTCIDRRNLGRGQEPEECPFDRGVERGSSREELDRNTGRSGEGNHRDSATARRDRSRGESRGTGRSR